ncbi:diguanylate cyclase [Mesorhizobium sp. CN2-181]|uniref:GGDEF domain-containing protein n=1 Tax=Mesorhizobium yinganensis TaxID=3157707 RepID=UPI0032B77958
MLDSRLRSFRVGLARSLRLRVLLLVLAAFVAVAIPAALSFNWLVNSTIVKLGTLFAEKQVLYDRSRGLEALMREVALAETLSRSPAILAWTADENDPEKRARGIAEMEHFRLAFRDRSYFLAIGGSGNYYFNDAKNSFAGSQLRYALEADNPRDGWYYKTAALGAGCQLNVDNDDNLKVTKVWINCVIREDGRTLGILGTGIDLTSFIQEVVNTHQAGVDTMFVDRFGAVQAVRDASKIDFHSLTKEAGNKKTVFQLVDSDADRASLAEMLRNVSERDGKVEARFVEVGGHRMLVGVGYLDRLGWYNVTFMDVDQIIDRGLFVPIGLLLALVMVAAAGLITLLFKRVVLDRLERAEAALAEVEAGNFTAKVDDGGKDEIGRLANALTRMAASVRDNTATLEAAVEERTEQLRRIAYLDPMTGILNRRGFAEAFAPRAAECAKRGVRLGLLLLDVDRFKSINDARGHSIGDTVIREVAQRLTVVVRKQDICARWGGDEFVVLVSDCSADTLADLSARILDTLRAQPVTVPDGTKLRITTSIGGHLLGSEEDLDAAAHKADLALYAAKRAGRNRTVMYDAAAHGAGGASRVA